MLNISGSHYRILLANVRNLGNCPCPRCLTPMADVPNLGTAEDRAQRSSLARNSNAEWQDKISSARNLIYRQNYAVTNDQVEAKLKSESLTPNTVSYIIAESFGPIIQTIHFRTHFQSGYCIQGSSCTPCS